MFLSKIELSFIKEFCFKFFYMESLRSLYYGLSWWVHDQKLRLVCQLYFYYRCLINERRFSPQCVIFSLLFMIFMARRRFLGRYWSTDYLRVYIVSLITYTMERYRIFSILFRFLSFVRKWDFELAAKPINIHEFYLVKSVAVLFVKDYLRTKRFFRYLFRTSWFQWADDLDLAIKQCKSFMAFKGVRMKRIHIFDLQSLYSFFFVFLFHLMFFLSVVMLILFVLVYYYYLMNPRCPSYEISIVKFGLPKLPCVLDEFAFQYDRFINWIDLTTFDGIKQFVYDVRYAVFMYEYLCLEAEEDIKWLEEFYSVEEEYYFRKKYAIIWAKILGHWDADNHTVFWRKKES